MTGDALRTQLAQALPFAVEPLLIRDFSTGELLGKGGPIILDALLPTITDLLARARAEGAAEALRDAAHVLSTDSDEAIEVALGGVFYAAHFLRLRASALSAHTTEGDPT